MPTTSVGPFMLTAKDINFGRILYEQARRTSWEAYNTLLTAKSRPKVGDVLVTKDGTLGRIAVVDRDDVCINQSVALLRPSNRIRPQFLKYLLEEPNNFAKMLGDADGSTIKHIYVTRLAKMEVSVPEVCVQDQILDVLFSLDRKISLNRQTTETLESIAQAIFRDWFVDFGPIQRKLAGVTDPVAIMGGLNTDPIRAAELSALFPAVFGAEGLPIGWDKESLLDQAHWVNGAAYKNMHFVQKGLGLPVVKIAELKAGITNQTRFTNTDLGQKYRISDGELLFSWSGNPDTSIDAFIWTGGEAWLNQHIFAVRENGKMDRSALYTLLKWLMPQFSELARNKQTTGLGHVTKDDMKRLLITKPTPPVAAAFAAFVGPIFDRLVATLLQNVTLAATRDYLLPILMSGAVRVAQKAEID
ncbi:MULTISPECIES: restriction endonuclease subunit S [unclassified Bradyrhizobium]|nr:MULTISPECIES: restriction endonuclease subunit S [unclassified Bradyrhizobium]